MMAESDLIRYPELIKGNHIDGCVTYRDPRVPFSPFRDGIVVNVDGSLIATRSGAACCWWMGESFHGWTPSTFAPGCFCPYPELLTEESS